MNTTAEKVNIEELDEDMAELLLQLVVAGTKILKEGAHAD